MRLFLIICFLFFGGYGNNIPEGWTKVEKKAAVGKTKLEVYFFDYMSRVEKLHPDFSRYKGRAFTNILEEVQFQFPCYVAKRKLAEEDSSIYYVLRPNIVKKDQPYFFDLQIVKVGEDFPLENLENTKDYEHLIIKTIYATGCRGSLVCEHNRFIQNAPDRQKLIGNGIQITDSIFTRVLPYEEIKRPFFKLIEANL
jgi:hypothetical protein